ncbi:hypothetical protein B0T19DRAFT_257455 [Cercophora scortea]|uniref:Uncharacterized protein n=1 Tax=Cercophora scortea TaxID=314031 RepID=A0AAE0I9Q4_9PEZI|nr:hypothetical protein B0T19DRAFT_257455 [Cercophora scortea]
MDRQTGPDFIWHGHGSVRGREGGEVRLWRSSWSEWWWQCAALPPCRLAAGRLAAAADPCPCPQSVWLAAMDDDLFKRRRRRIDNQKRKIAMFGKHGRIGDVSMLKQPSEPSHRKSLERISQSCTLRIGDLDVPQRKRGRWIFVGLAGTGDAECANADSRGRQDEQDSPDFGRALQCCTRHRGLLRLSLVWHLQVDFSGLHRNACSCLLPRMAVGRWDRCVLCLVRAKTKKKIKKPTLHNCRQARRAREEQNGHKLVSLLPKKRGAAKRSRRKLCMNGRRSPRILAVSIALK